MLGKIFAVLVLSAFACASVSGNMAEVCRAALDGAGEAVNLSLSLLGMMCLWSGLIRTLDRAGFTRALTGLLKPFLSCIYTKKTRQSAALNDIAADYSANFLGLGNAALPIGIRAMESLKKCGLPSPDTANDDMVMFAVAATVPFQLIPTSLGALRTAHGSASPFEILVPVWICMTATVLFSVVVCKLLAKVFH